MKKLSYLSVFFPAYNDNHSIGKLVSDAFDILPSIAHKYEVIVINDGSSDNTQEILEQLEKKYQRLRIINHENNLGYGGALKSGFNNAFGDYIFYTDGDGQYDVKELTILVEKMAPGVDLVNGYKIKRHDPLIRLIIGQLYSSWVRLLLGIRFADVDCDFRLLNKQILKNISLTSNSGAICAELLLKIQQKRGVIIDIPVHHYNRKYGNSQFFNPIRIFKTLLDDIKLWLMVK